MNSARQGAKNASIDTLAGPPDAVAEWRALQTVKPPVQLADHLTWLRITASLNEPRLLKTVADRPGVSERSDDGGGCGGVMGCETEQKTRMMAGLSPEYLNKMVRKWRAYSPASADGTPEPMRDEERGVEDPPRDDIRLNGNPQHSPLTHNVHTRMKDTWAAGRNAHRAVDDGGSKGCNSFHLVVDGAVFQIDATNPKGIFRVWANVLPRVSGASRIITVMLLPS